MKMKMLSVQNQIPLPDIQPPPNGWHPDPRPENYVLSMSGGSFTYISSPGHKLPPAHHGKSPKLDIKVQKDIFVRIELDPDLPWQWAAAQAITMGVETQDLFNLEYLLSDGSWSAKAGSTPKVIRFGARRRPGNQDDHFPFNMNFEIIEADGIVPVTVDPDIRNPGGVPVPTGGE